MFIQNQHIGLRAMEAKDIDLLYAWENNTDLWSVSNAQTPFNRFTLEQFVNASHQDIYTNKQLRLMIVSLANQKTVGTVDLYEFDPQHARSGIGIFIDKSFRGKGYAKECVDSILKYAFHTLHLKQLHTHVNTSNTASIALFESCGFEKSGLKKYWHKTGINTFEDVWFMQCYHVA